MPTKRKEDSNIRSIWRHAKNITNASRKRLSRYIGKYSSIVPKSKGKYSIRFIRLSLPTGQFFIPEFATHRPAVQAMLRGNLYEPTTHRLVPALLQMKPGSLVHAGTFFGDMLPTFSRSCQRTVYAFEPVLENYILAKLCAQENELGNVYLLNAGLGSTISTARIDTGDDEARHRGGTSKISDKGQLTTLLTIDAFHLDDVSIIHLDVEGYEIEALRGAIETIERNVPIVMIEDNRNNCANFLESFNYAFCGRIPGLSIWASGQDFAGVQEILESV